MPLPPALKVIEDAGVKHSVSTFEAGKDHFGDHVAAGLDVEPERVLKTLIIDLTAGKGPRRELAVCVIPTTHHLSLKKAAAALGVLVWAGLNRPCGLIVSSVTAPC
ncbi:Cys-tRNA(Pro)/Cys-tRNA(Cys) deacylase YbaK [Corynebacterium belfantii]|nr:Cys-tRNA(Pro)/Cys-tRNA(Cys) deacylase YbaK [Corynebacterium belfantii]